MRPEIAYANVLPQKGDDNDVQHVNLIQTTATY